MQRMAFRKVLTLAACLSAASCAPQTLEHTASPLIRTVATHSALPSATVFRHSSLEHSAPLVQQVRAVSHATHAVPAVQQTFIRAAQPSVVTHATHAVPTVVRTAATHVVAQPALVRQQVEVAANPNYSFGYSVADTRSGDSKTREETRDGDVVTGSYSVADPDGRIRRVEYTADKYNGFQAHVTYDGADGPPAIPIDGASTATAITDDSAVVLAGRTDANNQATILRAIQPSDFQTVRTINANPTFISTGGQLVRTVPSATVLRTAPTATVLRSDATHVVRNAGTHTLVSQPQVIRAFGASPLGFRTFNVNGATTLVHA